MYGYWFEAGQDPDGSIGARINAAQGDEPIKGLILHMTTARPDGSIVNTDIWASKEDFEAGVRDRIMPATRRAMPEWGELQPPDLVEFDVRHLAGDLSGFGSV